jgi:hypothetical protein
LESCKRILEEEKKSARLEFLLRESETRCGALQAELTRVKQELETEKHKHREEVEGLKAVCELVNKAHDSREGELERELTRLKGDKEVTSLEASVDYLFYTQDERIFSPRESLPTSSVVLTYSSRGLSTCVYVVPLKSVSFAVNTTRLCGPSAGTSTR